MIQKLAAVFLAIFTKIYGWYKRVVIWKRGVQFRWAYAVLRKNYERHLAAKHPWLRFSAVNEASIHMECYSCPELQPWSRRRDAYKPEPPRIEISEDDLPEEE